MGQGYRTTGATLVSEGGDILAAIEALRQEMREENRILHGRITKGFEKVEGKLEKYRDELVALRSAFEVHVEESTHFNQDVSRLTNTVFGEHGTNGLNGTVATLKKDTEARFDQVETDIDDAKSIFETFLDTRRKRMGIFLGGVVLVAADLATKAISWLRNNLA